MKNIRSEVFKTAMRETARLLNAKVRDIGNPDVGIGEGDINELDVALETLMEARNNYLVEFDLDAEQGELQWTPKEGEAS